MRLRLLVPVVMVGAVGVLPASPGVSAADLAASPMDFRVQMSQGSMGSQPDCDPPMDQIGQKLMSGGSIDLTCTINEKSTDEEMSGTVSNPTLVATDAGFNDGTITQTCDMDQQLEMAMTIGMGTNTMKKFKGKIAQACAWTMEFEDAESSTLSGTMEMNGSMGSDDGEVANNVVTMKMTMKVYMVDGTGIFDGYTGGGEFTRTEDMNMLGGGSPGQGGSPSGGTPGTGSMPTSSTVPGSGSGQMPANAVQICTANGINPCTSSTLQQFCTSNPTACASLASQSVRSAGLLSAVRAFSEGDSMTMKLKKGAGAVRIIGPAAPTGQPKAAAVVKASTKIEIVATPGAKCTVRTNKGRIVATKTVTSAGLTVLKPKSGSYRGATSLRASCKIGSATVQSNVVKIKLG